MFHNPKPYNKPLDNGLILKSISTENEIERLAAFNVDIHEDALIDRMTRTLIMHHPSTHPQEWLFVEDPANGEIVSSLCLIPWKIQYETVELKAAEMGIVGTLPEYRRQGLIRALDARFQELMDEGEYDLSHIQGIPYYYQQFGYEYALPLEGGWELALHKIPDDCPPYAAGLTFRQATVDDIPILARFYDEAMSHLGIRASRDEAIWHYLISQETNLQGLQETWLVEKENVPLGYFRVATEGFGQGLIVDEASHLPHAAAVGVLCWLKGLTIERKKPYIRLSMSDVCPLVPTALAWGAHVEWKYAWQIKIPDPARLLRHIAPVLEQRLANSPFAGLTQSVIFNLYRKSYELRFEDGQIAAVNALGICEDMSICIPPMQFAPLVFGYKNREELQATFHDIGINGQARYLVDVLFPKMSAFLHLIY